MQMKPFLLYFMEYQRLTWPCFSKAGVGFKLNVIVLELVFVAYIEISASVAIYILLQDNLENYHSRNFFHSFITLFLPGGFEMLNQYFGQAS